MTNIVEIIARGLLDFAGSEDGVAAVVISNRDDIIARKVITALETAGYAIVPVEPTEAMIEAAHDVPFIAIGNGEYIEPDREDIYRAMITAGKGDG